MQIKFKGLKVGSLIFTNEKNLQNIETTFDEDDIERVLRLLKKELKTEVEIK
ncbi:hypothetical protein KAI04_04245 [Candidatus Pacearchaeota archaeon]|nr:hypothetical protein [Candidatus Pacearchaeota archaeon]